MIPLCSVYLSKLTEWISELVRAAQKAMFTSKNTNKTDGDSVAAVRSADDKRNCGGVVTLTYLPLNMHLVRSLCDVDGLIRS
ncbi:hypothetical protein DPX16_10729 [Anabarilius grahami]|uniref:Uncharacterized protein n=1 Tax=Anabarilius grahami TaxID=495550 RepID=A0A3N0Z778_ANAGA|nr:hypothetical protein DPX16_10729 [Anabarilius grahami]